MTRILALVWLAAVCLAGGYLTWRVASGLTFRTDILALLPRDERDPAWQGATDALTQAISGRIVLLVGDSDQAIARSAATSLTARIAESGVAVPIQTGTDTNRLRQLGAHYFPYRNGLLSEADRQALHDGRADAIAMRALSQVFGMIGVADGALVQRDPFLTLPAFFADLPLPYSRLAPDRGMLSTTENGIHWVFIAARITGEPYALAVQNTLGAAIDHEMADHPGLRLLRLGAPFFAKAGADQAMRETSSIGIISTIGTVLVVLAAFRALAPLWLSLLTIGVGVLTAVSASLLIFQELHVGALLFGVSLIGVAVDYSLQYCTETFGSPAPPRARLRRVFGGIALGTATTIVGYLTLLLAPFPGLHQIAAFSAIGLAGAWLTVVLWLPALDRSPPARHGKRMLAIAAAFLAFWTVPHAAKWRNAILCLIILLGIAGLPALRADDDIRNMQSLSPDLLEQQRHVQALIGGTTDNRFFLIRARDTETALRLEETLGQNLRPLLAAQTLGGFGALAQFVPSAQRQAENRLLVRRELGGARLVEQAARLSLPDVPAAPDDGAPFLTPAEAIGPDGPFAFLSLLILPSGRDSVLHAVTLEGVRDPARVAAAAKDLEGVHFVDPTGDFSRLLGQYRLRAVILLAVSAALMAPLLVWRYGWRHGAWVFLPPVLAAVLTIPLRALGGASFNFFDAMALILILSVGMDYAVFCAESQSERQPVTVLAVLLAASTALMSFGLLALSQVTAVSHFGATMTVGILLALLLAPLACRRRALFPAGPDNLAT